MSGTHARLSASSAHRWLRCAGSLGESKSSAYAAAGTFAHSIAAACLEDGAAPANWLGNKTIIDGFTVECDQEMVDAVQVYLDAANDVTSYCARYWIEMPLLKELQSIDPDMGGTADFVAYDVDSKHLIVMDFKFGSGSYVEVDDNEQLKVYALGAMLAAKEIVHTVEVIVVQPRFEGAAPVRSWTFKAIEILEFVAQIKEAADRTRLPNPPLVSGEHCKSFCPNARTCPELEKMHHDLVAAEFGAAVPYDPVRLAAALGAIPLVKERIKAIEEFAYSEATAGRDIPGYKLVDKRPSRQWRNEGDVVEWAQANAVDPFKQREVLSPAQLEKRLTENAPKGKKKETAALLDPFTQKVSSGTTLVPIADDRPAAKLISVDDFEVIDGTSNVLFNPSAS